MSSIAKVDSVGIPSTDMGAVAAASTSRRSGCGRTRRGRASSGSATPASASGCRRVVAMEFTPQPNAIVLLHVDDVAAARAELEAKGVEFVGETVRHERLPHGDVQRSRRQPLVLHQPLRTVDAECTSSTPTSFRPHAGHPAGQGFYADTLGLEIETEGDSDMEFRCGQVTLDVFDPSSIGQPFAPRRPGSRCGSPTSTRRAPSSRRRASVRRRHDRTGVCRQAFVQGSRRERPDAPPEVRRMIERRARRLHRRACPRSRRGRRVLRGHARPLRAEPGLDRTLRVEYEARRRRSRPSRRRRRAGSTSPCRSRPSSFRVDDVDRERSELEARGVEFVGDGFDSGVCNGAPFVALDGNGMMLAPPLRAVRGRALPEAATGTSRLRGSTVRDRDGADEFYGRLLGLDRNRADGHLGRVRNRRT